MYVDNLNKDEFVVVNVDSGAIIDPNIRVVRVKLGDKSLIEGEPSNAEMVEYALNKGVRPKIGVLDFPTS